MGHQHSKLSRANSDDGLQRVNTASGSSGGNGPLTKIDSIGSSAGYCQKAGFPTRSPASGASAFVKAAITKQKTLSTFLSRLGKNSRFGRNAHDFVNARPPLGAVAGGMAGQSGGMAGDNINGGDNGVVLRSPRGSIIFTGEEFAATIQHTWKRTNRAVSSSSEWTIPSPGNTASPASGIAASNNVVPSVEVNRKRFTSLVRAEERIHPLTMVFASYTVSDGDLARVFTLLQLLDAPSDPLSFNSDTTGTTCNHEHQVDGYEGQANPFDTQFTEAREVSARDFQQGHFNSKFQTTQDAHFEQNLPHSSNTPFDQNLSHSSNFNQNFLQNQVPSSHRWTPALASPSLQNPNEWNQAQPAQNPHQNQWNQNAQAPAGGNRDEPPNPNQWDQLANQNQEDQPPNPNQWDQPPNPHQWNQPPDLNQWDQAPSQGGQWNTNSPAQSGEGYQQWHNPPPQHGKGYQPQQWNTSHDGNQQWNGSAPPPDPQQTGNVSSPNQQEQQNRNNGWNDQGQNHQGGYQEANSPFPQQNYPVLQGYEQPAPYSQPPQHAYPTQQQAYTAHPLPQNDYTPQPNHTAHLVEPDPAYLEHMPEMLEYLERKRSSPKIELHCIRKNPGNYPIPFWKLVYLLLGVPVREFDPDENTMWNIRCQTVNRIRHVLNMDDLLAAKIIFVLEWWLCGHPEAPAYGILGSGMNPAIEGRVVRWCGGLRENFSTTTGGSINIVHTENPNISDDDSMPYFEPHIVSEKLAISQRAERFGIQIVNVVKRPDLKSDQDINNGNRDPEMSNYPESKWQHKIYSDQQLQTLKLALVARPEKGNLHAVGAHPHAAVESALVKAGSLSGEGDGSSTHLPHSSSNPATNVSSLRAGTGHGVGYPAYKGSVVDGNSVIHTASVVGSGAVGDGGHASSANESVADQKPTAAVDPQRPLFQTQTWDERADPNMAPNGDHSNPKGVEMPFGHGQDQPFPSGAASGLSKDPFLTPDWALVNRRFGLARSREEILGELMSLQLTGLDKSWYQTLGFTLKVFVKNFRKYEQEVYVFIDRGQSIDPTKSTRSSTSSGQSAASSGTDNSCEQNQNAAGHANSVHYLSKEQMLDLKSKEYGI